MGTLAHGSHLRKAFGSVRSLLRARWDLLSIVRGTPSRKAHQHLSGEMGCSCSGIQIQKIKLEKILPDGEEGTVRRMG